MEKAFHEVLDNLLDGFDPGPAPGGGRGGFSFATAPLIVEFGQMLAAATAPTPPPIDLNFLPRRPRTKTLSLRQRKALETFIRLGARLGEDFTRDELRAEFRSLALRYHPDRHPGSSDRESARLTTCFAQLTEAYERLQTVLFSIN